MACRLFRAFRAKHPSLVIASVSLTLVALLPLGTRLSGAPQSATTGGTQVSTPVTLVVDGSPLLSDGNGVFEPGERVVVAPTWQNGDSAQDLTGAAADFTGPAGPIYTLIDDFADYGVLDPGAVASCRDTGDCYEMDIGPEGVPRPATHWDTTFDETLSDGTTQRWALHVGDSFLDVPRTNLFYLAIETLLHHGVSKDPLLAQGDLRVLGCTESEFCPSLPTTRAQAAVFVLMGLEDAGFTPEPCVGGQERFVDVPAGSPFCPWIEELARRDITAGCGVDTYCPADSMTRAQMAVLLLRALHGSDFTPEPCTEVFTDVTCPSLFADWIEELFAAGITVGCQADPLAYCPTAPVTRGQKAAFVTRAFALTLYGPNAQNSPPAVEPATFTVAENSADGTTVGTVTVSDPDAGQSHTFAITGGNTDDAFAIEASMGEITVANGAALDFETTPTFSLTVEATDDGTPQASGSGTVTVELTDANDPPAVEPATFTVAENSADGTVVGTVTVSDPDAGQSHTFAITGGNTDGAFAIAASTGEITVANGAALDFETTPTFSLTVEATDDGTPPASGSGTVTVELTDANDPPAVEPVTFTVAENSADGTVVGTVTVDDPDAGQSHTFAITGGNTDGAFAIAASTGEITVANGAALDFETMPTFSLTVEATDDGTPPLSDSGTVTVELTDANDPPAVEPATFTVAENNADGTVVGTVTVGDPDAGQSHTFAITGGNTDGAFAIGASTGEVTVANGAALDFETTPTYSLTVEATDDGTPPLSDSGTVTVELTNVNEPPTAIDDAAATDEDTAIVLDVLTNDLDPDAGETLTIVAIGGAPAGGVTNNGTDVTYDPTVAFQALPEGGSAVDSFTYTVQDAGGFTDTATVTVTVAGLNDAPIAGDDAYSAIGNTRLAVEKDGPFGTPTFESTLGDVLEDDADPDTGDTFAAVPFSDTLPSGAELDLAADGSFFYTPPPGQITPDSFTYTVEDSFGATRTGTVTIDIAKRVWYVDNSANGGTPGTGSGTATDPFSTLSDGGANADPDDAEDASAAGDVLYVHQGDGTATNQSAGISLGAGQRLLGEGVDLVVDPDDGGPEPPATLFTGNPANRPQVTHSGAGTAVAVLANTASGDRVGLEIRGLRLSSTGGNAIDVTSANDVDLDVRIADNVVNGSGAEGIDVNVGSTDATQTLALHDNTITASGTGIDVARTAGTLTVTAFGNNTVTGATGGGGISVAGGGVVFDAVPGGSFDTVAGGTLAIGASGDPVGGGGFALVDVSGDLSYGSIDVHAGGGPGLRVAGTGTYTGVAGTRVRHLGANTGVVTAVGGAAVDLGTVTADVRLATVSSTNSSDSGVRLVGLVDGTGTTAQFAAGAGSAIGGAAGTAFLVDGGNATVAYGGTISNASGRSVVVQNRGADTATFTGNVSDTGTGVLLNTNNAASTVTFAGGLQLSTGTSVAFVATGGGTVNVCDENPCDPSSTGPLANTLTTTTATAINVSSATIGANGVTLRSIDSTGTGANTAIVLANTGPGLFHVTGTGSSGTGGTISNKTVDAMTIDNTDGSVTLRHMIFQDLGDMTGGIDTISGHDAIHGQQVDGGLVLDGVVIRRVSDNAIHGGTLPGGAATVWNGLTLNNVTIEDSNRFHVADAGDANNEGMVRILGIRGTVSITNSTLQRGGELVDFFVTSGALDMTATNNVFHYAYKEFTTGVLASIGNHCIDVTVQNDGDASVLIGDRANDALGNDFLNCAIGSVRVAGDAGGIGDIDVVIGQNEFTVDDHSSTLGADFFFPMGGVLVGSLGSDSASYDVVIDGNYFDEITNASGGVGQLTLAMTNGTWQVLVEDNTFDTPGNAPWFVRADSTVSASVLFRDNVGIKGAFCSPDPSADGGGCDLGGGQLCPGAAGYCGPGLRTLVDLQNGANVDMTIINDDFAEHDAGFDPGQTVEARVLPTGGGGMLCLDLQDNDAPDGYSLEEFAGDFDLVGSGTCPAGSPSPGCHTVLGNRGNRGGGGVATTVPPFVNVETGSTIDVVAGSCQQPTGPIF